MLRHLSPDVQRDVDTIRAFIEGHPNAGVLRLMALLLDEGMTAVMAETAEALASDPDLDAVDLCHVLRTVAALERGFGPIIEAARTVPPRGASRKEAA